ncbi:hypothetical protein AMS68_007752 [Peltaster fructicola]|uniref:ESCRT-II complex subunit VPS25 n=1 Tax=Peltaster fructicola TaxID=286661 RepID=A0A6H0Y5R2_9PEZI|nr:hypothetical protein AMS68_007752 [Peltaster fructicola]
MTSSSPQAAGLLSSPTTTASITTYAASPISNQDAFEFPIYSRFPPLYSIQPNLATQSEQMERWSSLITSYCAHYRIFVLSLSSLPPDLFHQSTIRRTLRESDIRKVLDWMAKSENGGRAEWIPANARNIQSSTCYVYWRTPTEWADLIYAWVDETGQKGTILTLYELRESDAVNGKDWRDMDEDLLKRVLNVLVKRGKAQIFGQEETSGIKFF